MHFLGPNQNFKEARNVKVALTQVELFNIVDDDFHGNDRLERVRFFLGCFTSQRFSQFERHSRTITVSKTGNPEKVILLKY